MRQSRKNVTLGGLALAPGPSSLALISRGIFLPLGNQGLFSPCEKFIRFAGTHHPELRAVRRALRARDADPASDVLDLLAAGLSVPEILEEMPDLEGDDIRACVVYASLRVGHPVLAA